MTHALQVLHTLQWHHPGGRALLQLAQAPTQDYHSYTHALLGGVEGEVTSPSGSPVRLQGKHRATKRLWPNRDATTRFPTRAWREGVLFGVHSAYVDGVGLPAMPQAEAELVVCVISALV